ncbi:hypothetical protein [Sideroxydans lithotrophicus]|uniref:Uncharacterized protein n=1 Tax=Sideroxydans lithotrophicus (strain ES-1) TaxID=580332 RepID=D5CT69_SIDLE|nr:hypothetical protein [Sideroxydans lithotrophicus]ADE12155.1 hypothetical protein Slit_1926 [Sideroxydans lithotrophicus ES-1]
MKKIAYFRVYPSWVHSELLNWARWCWLGEYPHPAPPICKGIERFYRRVSEEGSSDNVRSIQPIAERAVIVQEVWETLPHGPKLALRAEYPQRHQPRPQMSVSEYKAHLSNAVYKVMVQLEGKL